MSGPLASRARQRAASHIKATESGPPDTARTSDGRDFQGANSRAASACVTGDASDLAFCFCLAVPEDRGAGFEIKLSFCLSMIASENRCAWCEARR